jgi:DNA-binding NtrC family response regulator
MSPEILIVSHDDASLNAMLQVVTDAGYQAHGASTFEEGRRLLSTKSPDLVIADGRLGIYNGLHLLLKARFSDPEVGAIVTSGVPDRGLEADARQFNVQMVTRPEDPREWLAPISDALEARYEGQELAS